MFLKFKHLMVTHYHTYKMTVVEMHSSTYSKIQMLMGLNLVQMEILISKVGKLELELKHRIQNLQSIQMKI